MKKIVLLLSLCLASIFVGCSSSINNQTDNELNNNIEKVNLDFLNKNDILTLPNDGFTTSTWISITQNINGKNGVFFIKVSNKHIINYGTMDGLENKIPNGLSYESFIAAKQNSSDLLKKNYPYWCEIDNMVYNTHKKELPSYLQLE